MARKKTLLATVARKAATRDRKRAKQKAMRVSGKGVFTLNRIKSKSS
ncbi:hypothetical protein KBC99_00430 [Candidatus Saccharibacteria bacterium]|nr:hypothetical protein [Candidatus Saccharibacteria bacterium]